VRVVDFTEPKAPRLLATRARPGPAAPHCASTAATCADRGQHGVRPRLGGGGLKSQERDYLYVLVEEGPNEAREQRVQVFDVSDPLRVQRTRGNVRVYGASRPARDVPVLQRAVPAALRRGRGRGGLGTLIDVSKVPTQTQTAATWGGSRG
jgi:hypothetical protein